MINSVYSFAQKVETQMILKLI